MPGLPVAISAVRSAIPTASSPVTPSLAGQGRRRRSSTVTSASARSPSACTTRCSRQASRTCGFRCPSAATPEPPTLEGEPLVVCGDSHVAVRVEQRFERPDEVRPHLPVALVSKLGWLDVDALADPNARPQVAERADVVERPPQVGLQDDTEVLVTRLAKIAIEPQSVGGRGRVLHVDADEVVPAGCVADDRLEVGPAEVVVALPPQPR